MICLIIKRNTGQMDELPLKLHGDMKVKILKRMLACVTKIQTNNQQLHYNGKSLEDGNTLSSYGITSLATTSDNPAIIQINDEAVTFANGYLDKDKSE